RVPAPGSRTAAPVPTPRAAAAPPAGAVRVLILRAVLYPAWTRFRRAASPKDSLVVVSPHLDPPRSPAWKAKCICDADSAPLRYRWLWLCSRVHSKSTVGIHRRRTQRTGGRCWLHRHSFRRPTHTAAGLDPANNSPLKEAPSRLSWQGRHRLGGRVAARGERRRRGRRHG